MSRTIDFDIDQVVQKAMNTFWEKGFESTSMKDLVDATGLLKGSIYNTFGSKEEFFLRCLREYGLKSRSFFYKGEDPIVYLKAFFKRLIDDGKQKSFTKGCLIMNSCLEFADSKSDMANNSKLLFKATEKNFRKVVVSLIGNDDSKKIDTVTTKLLTAAFSIREISKFRKDESFLRLIANNALEDLDIRV